MSPLRQWHRLAFTFLLCLSVFGCGATEDQVSSETPAQRSDGGAPAPAEDRPQAGGVPGAPLNRGGGGGAIGAPIRIPAATEDQGRPLGEMQEIIESGIRKQCGGELCVTLRVEPRNDSLKSCKFDRTDPPQGTEVDRETIVVIVSGTQPCTDGPGGEGGEEPPDDAGGNGEPPKGNPSEPPASGL